MRTSWHASARAFRQIVRGLGTLLSVWWMSPQDPSVRLPPPADPTLDREVSPLIYELLDAHYDTAQLAAGLEGEPGWRAHLQYLSDLQRVGRETLAQMSTKATA